MLNNLKALVLILPVAVVIFWAARRACLRFMDERDFIRRRNLWIGLTALAFLSPNIWLVLLIGIPVLIWAGRNDPNPAALFAVLMFVFPEFELRVPKLMTLTPIIILSLCIAMPSLLAGKAARQSPVRRPSASRSDGWSIALLVVFCIIQEVVYLQIYSITEVLRGILSQFLLLLVPFLLLSRIVDNRKMILEVIVAYVLACSLMAAVGVLESARGWLLYTGVSEHWGTSVNVFGFLLRDGQLRAMAATGHSLALGFYLSVAFVFCVYLRRFPDAKRYFTVASILMWAGMFAAFSRGPWVTAVFMMFVYFWMMPGGAGRLIKSLLAFGGLSAVFFQTSFGERIYESLPFIGTVDSQNVVYRQRLFDLSMELIPLNPWFGDIFVTRNMESLRQGQGIIDIINGYMFIALHFGLLTLSVLLVFVLLSLTRVWLASIKSRVDDPDLAAAGSVIIAVVLGHMFFMWTAGLSASVYMWTGLGLAYGRVVAQSGARAPSKAAR